MLEFADSRHCVPIVWKNAILCERCTLPMRTENELRMCDKRDRKPVSPPTRRKERTDEEYLAVTQICEQCPQFDSENFLCKMQLNKGCSSCRTASAFVKFKRSGKACPDGRFPATGG